MEHTGGHRAKAGAAGLIDAALEAPIFPSFTRIGFEARRRLFGWAPLDSYDLSGRVVLVTGATSGLGRTAAHQFASMGADVVVLGRDPDRTARAAFEIEADSAGRVSPLVADMGDLDAVRAAAEQLEEAHERIDVLVHNAGALLADRTEAPGGLEATVASQVVGPFLLTCLLLEPLSAARPGRVVTVSSGGMYGANLEVEGLALGEDDYNGTRQYALAKRAQVVLNEMLAERVEASDVVFHSMHPGWADTPGVAESLPAFRTVVGPLLRSPAAGVDTMVWLAADDGEPASTSGGFWHDRRRRRTHRLSRTRRSDTVGARQALWDWVVQASGCGPVWF